MTTRSSTSQHHSSETHQWSSEVASDSTHPREGLFNEDAETIARELASKKVSPKGVASGMRMLTFYINRAGTNLSANRLKVLTRAKQILHKQIVAEKEKAKPEAN